MKYLQDFSYNHVLVLGLAKSGTAAANVLVDSGIKVRINDMNGDKDHKDIASLIQKGAETIFGSHPLSVLDGIDLIVKNPGIPYSNQVLVEAAKRHIPIVTEVELAGELVGDKNEMIAITGSNGKTTTTTLVYEMLKASSRPVKLAGNIGIVATEEARNLNEDDTLVLELSSFQLMGISKFRPRTAALLNLFEAHLDYHGTFESYINAKAAIFINQTANDYLVYNADDEKVVSTISRKAQAKRIPFSLKQKFTNGAWIQDDILYFQNKKIVNKKDIRLVGDHNLENILAAISISMVNGGKIDGIKRVLSTFTGVDHRLQFVDEVHGRLFYNDSKATNKLATVKALQAFNQPTILLAGGLDRGDNYESLLPYMEHVKALIVFGETKGKLKAIAKQANIDLMEAETVKDATVIAYNHSESGDVILLSPACASWDQYQTFEERGNKFVQAVHTLQ